MWNESKVEMSDISNIDFWWIQEAQQRSLYVGVGHHEPLTDEDEPCKIRWFHSIENKRLSLAGRHYPLAFINDWRKACHDTNVYRTLTLFDEGGGPLLLGPFLVDIDNSNGGQEDLNDALKVTRATIELLRGKPYTIQEHELRLFFTGRKGFNIEVQPSSLRINMNDTADAQIKCSAIKLDEIIKALRNSNSVKSTMINAVSDEGTFIDRIYGNRLEYKLKHPYIRLHNSISEWIPKSGAKMARRKIWISLIDLFAMSTDQICHKARYDTRAPGLSEP